MFKVVQYHISNRDNSRVVCYYDIHQDNNLRNEVALSPFYSPILKMCGLL